MSDFRARSNSEILDVAFELYRRHFLVFFAISIVASLPTAAVVYAYGGSQLVAPQSKVLIMIWGPRIFIAPFTEAVLTAAAAAGYMGSPVNIAESIRVAFARPVSVFFSMVAKGVCIAIGFAFFIVPGLIVFKRYFAIPATVVLENRSAGKAIRRSRELSDGVGVRIFALVGSVWLFSSIVSLMLQGIAGAIGMGSITASVDLIVIAAILPFSPIVATLLYYDVRIRKEAYDIELLSNALDTAQPLSFN